MLYNEAIGMYEQSGLFKMYVFCDILGLFLPLATKHGVGRIAILVLPASQRGMVEARGLSRGNKKES